MSGAGRLRVLGIDPGFGRLGWAVLEENKGSSPKLLASGTLETPGKLPLAERLLQIGQFLRRTIQEYGVDALAVEEVFLARNAKTAMQVAMVRGVVFFAAAEAGLRVEQFSPTAVKLALTGSGRASKEQVTYMVRKLVSLSPRLIEQGDRLEMKIDDEADAVAIALTFLHHQATAARGYTRGLPPS